MHPNHLKYMTLKALGKSDGNLNLRCLELHRALGVRNMKIGRPLISVLFWVPLRGCHGVLRYTT